VKIEAVATGEMPHRLLGISPQLIRISSLAGIVAGDGKAAAEVAFRILKATDVIALPTLNRDRDHCKQRQGAFDIDVEGSVLLLG
jgi:hypothetical protein